jgi:hypothetical protein
MFCKYCGEQINPSRFCAHCGRSLTRASEGFPSTPLDPSPTVAVVEPSPNAISTRVSRAGKWVLLGAAALIGLVVLVGAAGVLTDKAGWKVPNVQTASTVSAAFPPSNSTAPSTPSLPEDDKYVAAVRNGVLAAPYNTTTIGKAFEATFTDCKWKSKESDKGARFVEFTGRLKPEMYKEAFDWVYNNCVHAPREAAKDRLQCQEERKPVIIMPCTEAQLATLPPLLTAAEAATRCPNEIAFSTVTFQFLFAADGSSFSEGYINPEPWQHTRLFTFKETGTVQHVGSRFSDGSPNFQWTEHVGQSNVATEDVMAYIYK